MIYTDIVMEIQYYLRYEFYHWLVFIQMLCMNYYHKWYQRSQGVVIVIQYHHSCPVLPVLVCSVLWLVWGTLASVISHFHDVDRIFSIVYHHTSMHTVYVCVAWFIVCLLSLLHPISKCTITLLGSSDIPVTSEVSSGCSTQGNTWSELEGTWHSGQFHGRQLEGGGVNVTQ